MKNAEQINSAVLRNVVETAPIITELLQNENIFVGVLI